MRSEVQKRADKKYRELGKDKYRNLSAKIHIDNIEKIKKDRSCQWSYAVQVHGTRGLLLRKQQHRPVRI